VAPLADVARGQLQSAVLLALGACALAGIAMPTSDGAVARAVRRATTLPVTAATAGGLSAVTASFAPLLGSFGAGVVGSLPLIGGSAVLLEHRAGGAAAAVRFLRGYVDGLYGKAAFGVVFAATIARLGDGCALTLATIAACVVGVGAQRLRDATFRTPAKPVAMVA
jgi:hypothetical protein